MRETIDLLRTESRARLFFLTLTQSALGTGAGYVALLLVAYAQFRSAWAITIVLIADLLPAMVLGPIFGAVADRWSRRACTVLADAVRAVAFVGIALVDSFTATVLFAAMAGIGTALFTPAALAGLPSLVSSRRLPAATSLYGAITDLGYTAGPAAAAVVLLFGGPDAILFVNGVTFAVSAAALARIPFGEVLRGQGESLEEVAVTRLRSLVRATREGLVASAGLVGIRTVLLASGAALFFGGAFNVAELPLASALGAEGAGYSILVALFGGGFLAGSLSGAGGGPLPHLKRRYLTGLLLMGLGFLVSGVVSGPELAALTFALAGYGNGVMMVYERLIIQGTVPDSLAGRLFGVKDALTAWAFALAFVTTGAVLTLVGPRATVIGAGVGGLVIWLGSVLALRRAWDGGGAKVSVPPAADPLGRGAEGLAGGLPGQHGAHGVLGRDFWLALLDDLDEGGDETRVELRAGIRG